MTIIVFLIDTSASMNQRTFFGPSFLDLAKGAVETFLKFRSRDPSSRGVDRYMLLTFEESPKNVKAGWKENQATFMQELRSLKASGLTTMGNALGNALHLLNINRLGSGIDNFGQGRYPNFLEPAAILVITDGGKLTNSSGIMKELEVPTTSNLPGCELYKEPFRWDQRVFALVLRMPGHAPKVLPTGGLIPQDVGPLESMCDATGGRSYCITTLKMLNQCLESLVQKVQTGVVVNLEKVGSDPIPIVQDENKMVVENGFIQTNNKLNLPNHITTEPTSIRKDDETPEPSWYRTRKMFYVLRAAGRGCVVSHWPIPEPFFPDTSSGTLPPRNAHPVIKFKCDHTEPMTFNDLPFDKYELEPSPLTQYILERKQPTSCWQVFVDKSGKYGDLGHPFGYLKASSTLTCVNLFVMPYNYPVLVPLLDELKNTLKGKPSQIWRSKFEKYIRSIPPYYHSSLKKLLSKNGFNIMPENVDNNCISYNVSSYLSKVKHRAKEEFDRVCQTVAQAASTNAHLGIKVIPRTSKSLAARSELHNELRNFIGSDSVNALKLDSNDFNGFRIHLKPPNSSQSSFASSTAAKLTSEFRNPFDIPRAKLLHQMAKMRINLEQHISISTIPMLEGGLPGTSLKLQNAEELHSLPIAQMGNYQDYLKLMPQPLKPIDTPPIRQHAFGNPFKVDKRMLVDEADLDVIVVGGGNNATASSAMGSKSNRHLKAEASQSYSKSSVGTAPKRKAGPLPRDFRYRRSRSMRSSSDDDSSLTSSPLRIDEDNSSIGELSDLDSIASDASMSDRINEDFDAVISSSSEIFDDQRLSFVDNESFITINDDGERPSTSVSDDETLSSTMVPPVAKRPKIEKHTNSESFDSKLLPEMKRNLSRLIRKPGKDYRAILDAIDESSSPLVQNFLLNWSLDEALRLKRANLCEKIRDVLNSNLKNVNCLKPR